MSGSTRAAFNRRRAQRAQVSLPVSVVTMDAYKYLEVLDLSAIGGKLRGSQVPQKGKTALFRLDGFETLCKVIWADGDVCGVQFDDKITPPVLKHLSDVGRTATLQVVAPSA